MEGQSPPSSPVLASLETMWMGFYRESQGKGRIIHYFFLHRLRDSTELVVTFPMAVGHHIAPGGELRAPFPVNAC